MASQSNLIRVEVFENAKNSRVSLGYMYCSQSLIDFMRSCGHRVRVIS